METKTTVANSIPENLLNEIKHAISTKEYGSVEIYIENGKIVQITERTIKKTTTKIDNNYVNGNGATHANGQLSFNNRR